MAAPMTFGRLSVVAKDVAKLASDDRIDSLSGLALHGRCHMTVQVQRDRDVRMAQRF